MEDFLAKISRLDHTIGKATFSEEARTERFSGCSLRERPKGAFDDKKEKLGKTS